jgi:hypothetical protein
VELGWGVVAVCGLAVLGEWIECFLPDFEGERLCSAKNDEKSGII